MPKPVLKPEVRPRKRGGATLPCPVCSRNTRILDTRRVRGKPPVVYRERRCEECGHRFASEEAYVDE